MRRDAEAILLIQSSRLTSERKEREAWSIVGSEILCYQEQGYNNVAPAAPLEVGGSDKDMAFPKGPDRDQCHGSCDSDKLLRRANKRAGAREQVAILHGHA